MRIFKSIYSMTTVATMFMVLMMNTSCKRTGTGKYAFTDSICWEDSLELNGCKAYGKIEVDFPVQGDTAFLKGVRQWVNKTMGGEYKGKMEDGEKMVAFYGKQYLSRNELEFTKYNQGQTMPYDLDIRIKVLEEKEQFVTYGFFHHIYTGGVHGTTLYGGATFLKSNGHLLGWDMFDDEYELSDELRDAIKQGLKEQFFGVETDEELMELLDLDNGPYFFPLPTAVPYVTREGIHFDYQHYEITLYAVGRPHCVVKIQELEELLTPEARQVIFNEKPETTSAIR